jgi:hypothetical protein
MTTLVDKTIRPGIKAIHDNCASLIQIIVDYKLVSWIIGLIVLITASTLSVIYSDTTSNVPLFFILPLIVYIFVSLPLCIGFLNSYR